MEFFSTSIGDRTSALVCLIGLCLLVGYFKGRFVLKNTVSKQVKRLSSIRRPLHISDLFTKKYLLLIAVMMSLGVVLRALPMHSDFRGVIDVAVGAALLFGASNYLRLRV